MLICKTILDVLFLLHKNKKLIDTIKHILEIFPEGVIIRSLNSSDKRRFTNFTNQSVQHDFELTNFDQTDLNRDNLQILVSNDREEEKNNQDQHIN